MISTRVFETTSIDLATFLDAAGHEVAVQPDLFNPRRALFRFAETSALRDAVIDYERGASLSAKRLLNVRSRLWREASHVVREGGR